MESRERFILVIDECFCVVTDSVEKDVYNLLHDKALHWFSPYYKGNKIDSCWIDLDKTNIQNFPAPIEFFDNYNNSVWVKLQAGLRHTKPTHALTHSV